MEKSLNFTGKTVDEAVEAGLKELGLTREDVEVEVLQEGKVRRIGKSVAAEVKLTVKEVPSPAAANESSDGARAVAFLQGLFKVLDEEVEPVLESEDEKIVINLKAEDSKGIIGRRGEFIDALQTLAGAVANTGRSRYKRVVVDFENYREHREETLRHVAEKYAAKAVRLGKKVRLEPMNPYERRIVHAALMDNPDVTTHSEGNEPARFVVITPKNLRFDNKKGGRDNRGNRGNNRGGNRDKYGNRDKGGKPYPNRTLPKESTPQSSGTTLNRGGSSYQRFFGSYLGNSRDEENNNDEVNCQTKCNS